MNASKPTTFAEFAEKHKDPISETLAGYFKKKKADAKELSPILVHSVETLEAFTLNGGKRVRSLLVLLGYLIAQKEFDESIYKIAAAIEIAHKYLLLLDDIADKDEMRNSKPTIWKTYESEFAEKKWDNVAHHGRTFAEIDGAILASFVTELVNAALSFSDTDLVQVHNLITKHMYFETVAGWQIQYQLNHVPLSQATEAEFMKGLELVTARYTFVAPLEIGYSMGGNSGLNYDADISYALSQYGMNVGTAFQLQDDILGLFGDPLETGKPVGNDVREGKKTLLLQKAYEKANQKDKEFLEDVCGRELSQDELTRVQELVKSTGSLAYSQELAKKSIGKGVACLSDLPESAEKSVLIDLANFVIKRNV